MTLFDLVIGWLLISIQSLYVAALFLWGMVTVFYGWKLLHGYRHRLPTHQFVFPFWRKLSANGGNEPKLTDSLSSFWVWIVLPFCLFIMAFVPLFPNDITRIMAESVAFWTSTFGMIGSALANYYFGKRLTTAPSAPPAPAPAPREPLATPQQGGRDDDQRGG